MNHNTQRTRTTRWYYMIPGMILFALVAGVMSILGYGIVSTQPGKTIVKHASHQGNESDTLKLGPVNAYLLKMRTGYLLIDAGVETSEQTLEKLLSEVGIGLDDITHVFLTHHHHDHVGLVSHIRDKTNGNVTILMHEAAQASTQKGEQDATFTSPNMLVAFAMYRVENNLLQTKLKISDFLTSYFQRDT